jgi:hypothetical protein
MTLEQYLSLGLTALGLAGGLIAYIIGLLIALDRKLSRLESLVSTERILSIVNGKYVRSDLFQQAIDTIHERLQSLHR